MLHFSSYLTDHKDIWLCVTLSWTDSLLVGKEMAVVSYHRAGNVYSDPDHLQSSANILPSVHGHKLYQHVTKCQ